jgi:hypothetical protein
MPSWFFYTGSWWTNGPYTINEFPSKYSSTTPSSNISFDVLDDDSNLKSDNLKVYINNQIALDGYLGFQTPFNGSLSSITPITDGYSVVIDPEDNLNNFFTVRVVAEDTDGYDLDSYWGCLVNNSVNILYYSDEYNMYKIPVSDLVGECQSIAQIPLQYPDIASNNISYISGNIIDGYFCLAISHEDAYGVNVARFENEYITQYRDGYNCKKAQMTDSGTLYFINEDDNTIEVYYGAHFRTGIRSPDFIYSSSSTPSIISGDILDISIVSNGSSRYSLGTRLFVGTTDGVSRVETYDKHTNGFSDGLDGYGISYHYGISGSGKQHEAIGGTVSRVISVSSNENKNILFVGTNDGSGSGGVSQIDLTNNRMLFFTTQSNGLLPSNDIRNIFAKKVDS